MRRIPGLLGHLWMCVAIAALAVGPREGSAATRTWDGGGDGTNWFDGLNWGGTAPQDGDEVTIGGGALVMLTNSSATLSSFSITNATLIFTNWTTALMATNVTLENGAVLTHGSLAELDAPADTNRVHILCSNLTVHAGASMVLKGWAIAVAARR